MKKSVTLRLPPPPSMNMYYRRSGHIIHLSSKGRDYKQRVGYLVKQQTDIHFGDSRIRVHVDYTPETLRREDLDNKFKALLDSIRLYSDDSNIDQLSIRRLPKDKANAGVVVLIEEI